MFSETCVILFTGGGAHGWEPCAAGVCARLGVGACIAGHTPLHTVGKQAVHVLLEY